MSEGRAGPDPSVVVLVSAGDWRALQGIPRPEFNAAGQDWGLPAYRWDVVEAGGYEWLRHRTRRCAELWRPRLLVTLTPAAPKKLCSRLMPITGVFRKILLL